jgi:hypothetical protein
MITENELGTIEPPSKSKIAFAALVALVVAAIVLVVAILPAEYGRDPLGTGRLLGLVELNAAEGATEAAKQAQPAQLTGLKKGQIRTPPALVDWNRDHSGLYKVDSREIQLGPKEGAEFKYRMERGAGLVYTWDSPVKVRFEFHGEPDGAGRGIYESYAIDEADGVDKGSGTFIAPFTGIHGWFWENLTDSPITVRLTSAGFYAVGKEFRKGFQGDHELKDVTVAKRK